jgi:hypothetical protein
MDKYQEKLNKEILLFVNKELLKVNKNLQFGINEVNLCKNQIDFIKLRKKRQKLLKDKNLLIVLKCLNNINNLKSKAILKLKRKEYTINEMYKIETKIIEKENIITNIILN